MRLIDNWGVVLWHSATTRTTALVTYLLGAIGQYYFAGYLVLEYVPKALQPWLAGALTFLVFGGPLILARLVAQPKLQAKIQGATDAKPDC